MTLTAVPESVLAFSLSFRRLVGPGFLGLALLVAFGIFSLRARQLLSFVRLGQPVRRMDDLPRRVESEVVVVLGQRKLLQRFVPGIMHAFIFCGFLILLPPIVEAFGEVFSR